MPYFTTRVELHSADEDDYSTLHAAMENTGFSRHIAKGGITYHLPTAEYNYTKDNTKEEVLNLAKAAANTTGKKSAILVTESDGARVWDGLKPVA